MVAGKPRLRARDIDLLIRRVLGAGLSVEAVELTPDGALRILTKRPAGEGHALPHGNDWVALAGTDDAAAADAERRMVEAFGE